MKKRKIFILVAVCIFISGIIIGCTSAKVASIALPQAISVPHTVPAAGTIEVAFSPNGNATSTVIKAINEAKNSIRVQAYIFTSEPIAKALLDAQKRGVTVQVILDKSQLTEKYSSATFFKNNNISTKIDSDFQIAHSKVMIIDNSTIITGSFNFTKSAEKNNSENVLVIRGNKELAKLYIEDWEWRWANTKSL